MKAEEIVNKLASILGISDGDQLKKVSCIAGEPMQLEDGSTIYIDSDGDTEIARDAEGNTLPTGNYKLKDGRTLYIDNGVVLTIEGKNSGFVKNVFDNITGLRTSVLDLTAQNEKLAKEKDAIEAEAKGYKDKLASIVSDPKLPEDDSITGIDALKNKSDDFVLEQDTINQIRFNSK